jgi:DNA-binding transcriptional LysR family regulator
MHNISIYLLESFVVFSESVNMTLAAKTLGITQSALSKQLAQLESALPFPLFTFLGRKKILTPYGKQLASQLKIRFVGVSEEISFVSKKFGQAESASLRISARREILERMAHKIKFAGKIKFIDSSSDEILINLSLRKIDIGITQELPNSTEVVSMKLFSEEFKLIIPAHFKIGSKILDKKLVKEISEQPSVTYDGYERLNQNLIDHFDIKSPLQIQRSYSNWSSLCKMVDSGMGWTIAPDSFVTKEHNFKIIDLPKPLAQPTTFYLIHHKDLTLIPWFKELKRQFLSLLDT